MSSNRPQSGQSDSRTDQLKITEIFHSLQGEASSVGWPTVFVRLTGCPLRCQYCDTAYAFHGGRWMSFEEILSQVDGYAARYVTVTGGEPLAQKRCHQLLEQLCEAGFWVSLETSGAMDISSVDPRVERVVDIKTPGSGECERNLWSNIEHLQAGDQLKFVICDRADFDWSKEILREHNLPAGVDTLFSPSYGQLNYRELAEWILTDRLAVRFQMQMHKHIWGDEPGR
jgi:7-carboxy-7-deazaguanine synthase